MKHEEGRLNGVGGLQIYWQAWLPDSPPRGTVVLAHGVSEHSARYAHVGAALTEAGYALYALDHRGHGRSEGSRANIERMDSLVADLLSLVELATERQRQTPFLLGHSMGGAVSISFAVRHQDTLAGLILSGALAAQEAASPLERMAARVSSAVAPNLGVFAVSADGVSRDPEEVRKYVEDPMVHHGKLPARTVWELVQAVDGFPDQVPGLKLPLLVLHGGDDQLTPPAGSQMVEERAGSEDKTLVIYDGLYHEILNEPERDRVIADIVDWLDRHS